MGTVKDVFVATGARHRRNLAAVEADADVANKLRGWGRGGVRHCAAEMETLKREKEKEIIIIEKKMRAARWRSG